MSELRVLIVARDLLARTGLTAMLADDPDIYVVGQSTGGETLAEDANIYRPDVTLVDLGMDHSPDLPLLSTLVETDLPLVALLPEANTPNPTMTAILAGRSYGLLRRDASADVLIRTLYAVIVGLVVLEPTLVSATVPAFDDVPPLLQDLTDREAEVLQLLAEGLSNKIIATRLAISPNTVKFHVNAILSKLDARTRTEAVVRASRRGLILL
ncbi:MAG: response regulator transcription factor [Chloroflexota bacterium]